MRKKPRLALFLGAVPFLMLVFALPFVNRVDPVLAAAQVVVNLQSVVSRNVDPLKPAVLSSGAVHGGTTNNIIPSEVKLTGTVLFFGAGDGTKYPHHHPAFDFDEKALPPAAFLMTALALEYLN